MADITMPQLGETVTEGTITKWFKKVGDAVADDEPLFEVSTDKVDTEVPSPTAGFIAEIKVHEGDTVDVGAVIAVISAKRVQPHPRRRRPRRLRLPLRPLRQRPSPSPSQRRLPRHRQPLRAPAPRPRPTAPAPPPAAPAPAAPAAAEDGATGNRLLSPVVRRLLAEHGLDPATINGTGAGGRITREDVLAHIDDRHAGDGAPTPAPAARAAATAPCAGGTRRARPHPQHRPPPQHRPHRGPRPRWPRAPNPGSATRS